MFYVSPLYPDRENSGLRLKGTRKPPKGRAEKNLVYGKNLAFLWCKETGVYLHLVVAISLRNTRRLLGHPRLLAKSVRRWGNWICWITYASQLEGRSSLFRGQLQDDYCMERWKGESLFFVPRGIVELLNILFSYLNCFVHVFDGKCEKPFTTLTTCQLNAKFLWARCWCLTELKIAWRLWLRKNVFRNGMNRMRLLRSSSRADLC